MVKIAETHVSYARKSGSGVSTVSVVFFSKAGPEFTVCHSVLVDTHNVPVDTTRFEAITFCAYRR